jgi:hydrogenase maturation protein HypF
MKLPAVRITITGTVQGVGFRPFIYRIARQYGISGTVCNDGQGVGILAIGTTPSLEKFIRAIQEERPPLAVIRSCQVTQQDSREPSDTFVILPSESTAASAVDVARDTATCPQCLRELFDPHNRRYLHPFINCTECGPRYTVITGLPYDRPRTTMALFPLCPDCRKEYTAPADRRFHAQPICCQVCGPRVELVDRTGQHIETNDPIKTVSEFLAQGQIVAIKGLGGFHLACRADDGETVKKLRERKHREEKPLAVMARNMDMARQIAEISADEAKLLEGPERPIVILKKRDPRNLCALDIAPGLPTYGIMLPYTPLHHLLFFHGTFDVLVMTSANYTDEPIVYTNEQALAQLAGTPDYFLWHNRDIALRNDDSMVRVVHGQPQIIRRARGFVPAPVGAGRNVDGIVACGAMLKSTITIGRHDQCYISQHIGDAENVETVDVLEQTVDHIVKLLHVAPRLYACDLHPGYLSTAFAEKSGYPVHKVQHHHAHAAACMAENGLTGPALALVYDGTGYGADGTVWGGEVLLAGYDSYQRLGHFTPVPLPGNEAAIRNPGRMAMAVLYRLLGEKVRDICPWMCLEEKEAVIQMLNGTPQTLTSSAGRLFDALAAILDVCQKRTYEGQPAIMVEGIADQHEKNDYGNYILKVGDILQIDGPGMLLAAYEDLKKGTVPPIVSARFHNTIAQNSADIIVELSQKTGVNDVVLSGGCFQNVLLTEQTIDLLADRGLKVFVHRLVPPNDGCISFGQAVIAGAKTK